MGIKNWIAKQGVKAGNKIAKLSSLSPDQMEQIIDLRDQYFGDMAVHDPGYNSARLTRGLIAASGVEILNAYLPQLQELYTPVDKNTSLRVVKENGDELVEEFPDFRSENNIRYINITKWVTDKRENSLEKLVNVYAVLSEEECNIALIFHRTKTDTQVILAVVNTKNANDNHDADDYAKRLTDAIRGNFPGTEFTKEPLKGVPDFLKATENCSVASATNIPTEKSEKFISQTIEKLLDGIVPTCKKEEYTLILLATPVKDVETRKIRLAELYSGLAPYSEWQTNFTYTDTMAHGSTATFGVNVGASAGIQNGQNQAIQNGTSEQSSENDTVGRSDTKSESDTITDSEQVTTGESVSDGESYSTTHTDSRGEVYNSTDTTSSTATDTLGGGVSVTTGSSATAGGSALGMHAEVSSHIDVSATVDQHHSQANMIAKAETYGKNSTASDAKTIGKLITIAKIANQTVGKTKGKTHGSSTSTSIAKTLGRAVTNSTAKTAGVFRSFNLGGNVGASFARSSNVTATIGKGEGITQNFTNYTVKHALELLEEQMKRYEQSAALGMWDFAAYVISDDVSVANNVAHTYLALTEGETSYLSRSAVNLWRGDVKGKQTIKNEAGEDIEINIVPQANMICSYLRELRHPEFVLDPNILFADTAFFTYPPLVTATTCLSGKELAYSLNFPNKSIAGLPVYECAEFGRNIATYDTIIEQHSKFCLGNIFHMNHEESLPVHLQRDSLASHTFVTGSTGSGKSNTVYQLLLEGMKQGVHFLVIEPAKGEYKHIFGTEDNISVYGTNSRTTPLLRLNPFAFNTEIHVLEHIDRLSEIFNVCWPMYAAMPAVLKRAVELAYSDCGWDLKESYNAYGEHLYPCFADVARNVKAIIDTSEYDTENKGAYKGSLLTRLQSLTTGINSMIFTDDAIPDADLFDSNVIVDLSRIGSSETKSLIMGILVLKLQEYRMSSQRMNSGLQHLTVLEEAHHLLKRTSTEQPIEGGNLIGKSVEMLANAIAEMRTYGEGFIIADQAPGLLDLSVIRNTNTKIILRLPDQSDRNLVGKAAGLNEDQIAELAKLPCGVAAVYQNDWIQAVLCKVTKVEASEEPYRYYPEQQKSRSDCSAEKLRIASLLSSGTQIAHETIMREIVPFLQRMHLTAFAQVAVIRNLGNPASEPRMTKLAPIFCELFPEVRTAVAEVYRESRKPSEWTQCAEQTLLSISETKIEDQVRRDIVQAIITGYIFNERNCTADLERWHREGGLR